MKIANAVPFGYDTVKEINNQKTFTTPSERIKATCNLSYISTTTATEMEKERTVLVPETFPTLKADIKKAQDF